MPSMSRSERAALCNCALDVGPDAPTLCEGWTVKDLVVHLLVRERDPVAATGIVVPRLAGLTGRKSRKLAEQDFAALVERVRQGPPPWSLFALPPVERVANTLEHVVHHEDVRRAQPGWEPRELTEQEQAVLWRAIAPMGRRLVKPAGVPVELAWGERRTTLAEGPEPVVVTGEPLEAVMLLFGRDEHRARLEGPADAVRRVRDL